MTNWQFVGTWNGRAYVPYRMANSLSQKDGWHRRTIRSGLYEAEVLVPESYGGRVADVVIRQVAQSVANLPGVLTQRLTQPMVIAFVPDLYAPATYYAPELIEFDADYIHEQHDGGVFLGHSSRHRNFEELLAHELAHAFDYALGRPSESTACFVTEYARTSDGERFAEGLVAFLQFYAGRDTLGRHRDALRERLGTPKMRFFGELLSPGASP